MPMPQPEFADWLCGLPLTAVALPAPPRLDEFASLAYQDLG